MNRAAMASAVVSCSKADARTAAAISAVDTRPAIVAWGRFARAALGAERGRVIAAFARSCYVETETGLACLGALGDGPLNARCPPLCVEAGAAMRRRGSVIEIGAQRLATSDAAEWRPRPGTPRLDPGAVALLAPPEEGLGAIAVALARGTALPTTSPLLRRAVPAVEALRRRDLDRASCLFGLGPGLTPSGDDLVGGFLLARPDAALGAWAVAAARARTSPISAAHLAAAAAGEASAVFHDALAGGPLGPLLALGHSSGWDMLAGAMLALACPP
jgi:hypothetical protein